MNLSGIAISIRPQRFDDTVALLGDLPGVEVHYQDPASARIVVVQEAESVDDEVAGLKRIKSVPGVVVAELVYHYFADDQAQQTQPNPELDAGGGINDSVLRRLNPN
jgi:nitrate reductase NapD